MEIIVEVKNAKSAPELPDFEHPEHKITKIYNYSRFIIIEARENILNYHSLSLWVFPENLVYIILEYMRSFCICHKVSYKFTYWDTYEKGHWGEKLIFHDSILNSLILYTLERSKSNFNYFEIYENSATYKFVFKEDSWSEIRLQASKSTSKYGSRIGLKIWEKKNKFEGLNDLIDDSYDDSKKLPANTIFCDKEMNSTKKREKIKKMLLKILVTQQHPVGKKTKNVKRAIQKFSNTNIRALVSLIFAKYKLLKQTAHFISCSIHKSPELTLEIQFLDQENLITIKNFLLRIEVGIIPTLTQNKYIKSTEHFNYERIIYN